ncbi:hypothetical protein [Streptomyces sp. NPDC050504]|uniref:hypothetical protein n=1 Tax=Streptomyces sp. NPDC050504 TaxID=3365618 RepID=UPI00379E2462
MPSLHLSLVLVLAGAAVILCRKGGTKVSHALICAGFGFYLADTAAASAVHSAVDTVLGTLSQFG